MTEWDYSVKYFSLNEPKKVEYPTDLPASDQLEYFVRHDPILKAEESLQEYLNTMGRAGWELCSLEQSEIDSEIHNVRVRCIFKRPR